MRGFASDPLPDPTIAAGCLELSMSRLKCRYLYTRYANEDNAINKHKISSHTFSLSSAMTSSLGSEQSTPLPLGTQFGSDKSTLSTPGSAWLPTMVIMCSPAFSSTGWRAWSSLLNGLTQ